MAVSGKDPELEVAEVPPKPNRILRSGRTRKPEGSAPVDCQNVPTSPSKIFPAKEVGEMEDTETEAPSVREGMIPAWGSNCAVMDLNDNTRNATKM